MSSRSRRRPRSTSSSSATTSPTAPGRCVGSSRTWSRTCSPSTCCSAVRAGHDDRRRPDPEAGLDIHAAEAKTPVEALTRGRPVSAWPDPEPIRLPVLRRSLLRWEGQCRACGAWNSLVETVVREPRPRGLPTAPPVRRRRSPLDRTSATSRRDPRAGRRDRRARPGPRRRARRRVAGPARWRAGHRQVDAPAPGRGRRRAAPVRGVLYATGEESAAQVRLRAGRLGLLDGPAGDRDPGRRRDRCRADRRAGPIAPARPRWSSIPSRPSTVDELDGPAGERRPGPRGDARLMELAKGEASPVVLVGPRDQGRLAGRARRRSSTSSTPSSRSRASGTAASASCARRRTGSARPRRSASSRWASAASRGRRPGPGVPRRARRRRPPGSVVAPTLEGTPAAARGGPGARRAGRGAARRAGRRQRRRSQPAGAAGRRARTAGRDRPRRPRRLRQPRRRAGGRRARPRPAARARPRVVPARPADRAGTVAIGEVGLLGELAVGRRPRRRLREAARLGFTRAIVPRSRGRCRRPCPARDRRGRVLREALRLALGDAGPAPSGRGGTVPRRLREAVGAMLGSAARAGGRRRRGAGYARERDPQHPCPRRRTRRLHRARPGRRGRPVPEPRLAGCLLAAWVVAWVVVGFADPAVPDGRAGGLADPKRSRTCRPPSS